MVFSKKHFILLVIVEDDPCAVSLSRNFAYHHIHNVLLICHTVLLLLLAVAMSLPCNYDKYAALLHCIFEISRKEVFFFNFLSCLPYLSSII